MCIFSGPVASVGSTKIFARLQEGRQYLAYSMSVAADKDVAMILPLPVSSHAEDAVNFIALDDYPEFFDDMELHGFPPTKSISRGGFRSREPLKVHSVGNFTASFVPTMKDFDRLDPTFRLPAATWEAMPKYNDWGFAVFQLKPGAQKIHPMAFSFPTVLSEMLYFPTKHVHDGKVEGAAEFDHVLYFQGDQFRGFAQRGGREGRCMAVHKTGGIVAPDLPLFKTEIVGRKPNGDMYVGKENHKK